MQDFSPTPLEKAQRTALVQALAAGATTIEALRSAGYTITAESVTHTSTDPQIRKEIFLVLQKIWPEATLEELEDRLFDLQLERTIDFALQCKNPAAVVNARQVQQKHRTYMRERMKPLESQLPQIIREVPVTPALRPAPSLRLVNAGDADNPQNDQ
jgi:hypothetical protein